MLVPVDKRLVPKVENPLQSITENRGLWYGGSYFEHKRVLAEIAVLVLINEQILKAGRMHAIDGTRPSDIDCARDIFRCVVPVWDRRDLDTGQIRVVPYELERPAGYRVDMNHLLRNAKGLQTFP